MAWSYIFSVEIQIVLFSLNFSDAIVPLLLVLFFTTDIKFLMLLMFVVVVWFCCSSQLAFLILAYPINLMHHILLHWKILEILGFSICSSFGRQLCQNCGWAGSEPYVQSHITEPPCFTIFSKDTSADQRSFLWQNLSISSKKFKSCGALSFLVSQKSI